MNAKPATSLISRFAAVMRGGRTLWVLLAWLAMSLGAMAQVSNNVQLLSTMDPAAGGGYGDIWGYTHPFTQHEYALLCARGEGLYVIDITTPTAPTIASFVPAPPGSFDAKDVKTYLNYAYVVHQSGPLQIVDLTDPLNPTWTTFTNSSLSNGFHNIYIDEDGYAYIAIQTGQAAGDMRIFDVRTPTAPVEVGVFFHPNVGQGFIESHDIYARQDTAYVAYVEGGLVVLDVTDRSNPQQLSLVNYPGNFTHNVWTTEDGRYALTTDEVTNGHLKIWDLHDLQNVSLVSEYESRPGIIIHNVHVKGDFAYISYYVDGLRVVDISDITQPTEVGYYDTYLPAGQGFNGDWGVYPYFASGSIVLSDLNSGLYVVRFDSVRAGGLNGVVSDLLSGLPVADVTVSFVEAGKTVSTDASGFYELRTNEGAHTVIFSKPGYFPDTLQVVLPSGPSITQNLSLNPNLADIEVFPDSLSMTLPVNTTATAQLIISNVGPSGRLDYTVDDVNGPVMNVRRPPHATARLLLPGQSAFAITGIPSDAPPAAPSLVTSVRDTILTDPVGDLIFGSGGDVTSLTAERVGNDLFFGFGFAQPVNTDSAFAVLSLDLDFDVNSGAFPGGFGFNLPAQNIGSEIDLLVDVPGTIIGIPLSLAIFVGSNSPAGGTFLGFGSLSVVGNTIQAVVPLSLINDDGNMLVAGFTGHINGNVPTSIDYLPDMGNGTVGTDPLGDLPWLSLSSMGGSLTAGLSDTIIVTFDSNGLEGGSSFSGVIAVSSNDADEPLVSIPVSLTTEPVVGIGEGSPAPEIFALEQNYPNPFNPTTTLRFQIAERGAATLKVYNLLGQVVRTLVDENLVPGSYELQWDGRDDAGRPLASGIYIYRLVAGERFHKARKMVLLR